MESELETLEQHREALDELEGGQRQRFQLTLELAAKRRDGQRDAELSREIREQGRALAAFEQDIDAAFKRGGAAAKFLQPSAPSSYGDADSGGGRGGADDAEVEYWRRKIAELSAPVPGTASTSARSSLLSAPAAHARYASSAFSSGGAGAKATSLADEPLSWEGTSSYRDEQKSDVRESAEEILLDRRQESKGL